MLNENQELRPQSSPDAVWMGRALEQARRSVGLASPNPAVGCVLVKDGRVIGEGFHEYDRKDHAEIVALQQAGEAARGATAYVTLEPCSHTGRTGPCSLALLQAGVARVVVATSDPNPSVNGQGLRELRAAGIEVRQGVLQQEARRINEGFARYIRSGLPFVNLKAGLSLDGRIAPAPGSVAPGAPVFLTGEAARADVQQIRHGADALLTGINTILQDDPLLTDRSGLPRRRPLLRVVMDSALRVPLDSRLVTTAQEDVLIFCTIAPTERQRVLESLGVRVERVSAARHASGDTSRQGGVSIQEVLARLGTLGILSVMMEAGAQLNSSALAGGHVDKLTLYYAPVFLGPHAVPLVQEITPGPLASALPEIVRIGRDVRMEMWLRDPWPQGTE